ncbi:hypothetical protein GCM10023189_00450 [Nibrella saemangeumensis]|uniref:Uncharacterized protein n=1 Tax=Nibrella saemangeumensis TaxID=1084526 RepID=A0ABP8M7L0_9BACT
MKTRVIFASLVLGLGLVTSKANAATTILDDSPAANKPASALLINGSEKQLATYVEQRIGRSVRKSDWQNFYSIVELYNQNPVALLNLKTEARDQFNAAASQVNKQLAKQKGAEASRWYNQADYTTRIINFLWSVEASQQAELEL